ncbi:MAG: GMC family oxidoreductase [Actinobacteria bacterium]|nr:GMC family oxidoreductase [Actinomycetota bacterium]
MTTLDTEVLVIGSGAGGATTAAVLTRAGRQVRVVEEGPAVAPGSVEPFSLEEMVAKYRHRGGSAALGAPPIAYAEGRCVGGSTEINSGLWHRLPAAMAEQWRRAHHIDEFTPEVLDRCADWAEREVTVSCVPDAPPRSSAVLADGAQRLGWHAVEVPRVVRYEQDGAAKQTMAATLLPRAVAAGAEILADCRVDRLVRRGRVVVAAECRRTDGTGERLTIRADQFVVCGGAIQSPALLQRSGIRRRIGTGLKVHPTIKVAARFPFALDHGDVPMHRITEFTPDLALGGSANRRGQVALALADASPEAATAMADWQGIGVYYAAIRSEGSGRVLALPGLAAPVVTYRLTEADMSRLARGLVHLGEALLAAGAVELHPSVIGGRVVHRAGDLVDWWPAVTRARANLMTVHLTSSIGMGEDARAGTDSFGAVRGFDNLRVNDASLLPDAPGINPQATIMAIAVRNAEQALSSW